MSQRRPVVFFDAYPDVNGGAQRMALLLAAALPDRGWPTEFWFPGEGRVVDAARAAGITTQVIDVPASLSRYGRTTQRPANAVQAAVAFPRLWRQLARKLRGYASIVHADDHRGLVMIGPAARAARVPVVWHVHSIHESRVLNIGSSRLTRRIVIPSGYVASRMPGLGSGKRPVAIVPYVVPVERLDAPKVAPTGKARLVTVGRLHPDKALDNLMRACAQLRPSHPDLAVDVIGGSQPGYEQHEQDLLDLRRELGLDDVVTFHGYVEEPGALVAAANLYVQASHHRSELQPVAILEAMSQGAAIVATRAGGVPEMLDDDRTGVLVPVGDVDALAAAIGALLDDPARAAELGRNAQIIATERFGADAFVDSVVAQYEALGLSR